METVEQEYHEDFDGNDSPLGEQHQREIDKVLNLVP